MKADPPDLAVIFGRPVQVRVADDGFSELS